jgi:hypothetical protein
VAPPQAPGAGDAGKPGDATMSKCVNQRCIMAAKTSLAALFIPRGEIVHVPVVEEAVCSQLFALCFWLARSRKRTRNRRFNHDPVFGVRKNWKALKTVCDLR